MTLASIKSIFLWSRMSYNVFVGPLLILAVCGDPWKVHCTTGRSHSATQTPSTSRILTLMTMSFMSQSERTWWFIIVLSSNGTTWVVRCPRRSYCSGRQIHRTAQVSRWTNSYISTMDSDLTQTPPLRLGVPHSAFDLPRENRGQVEMLRESIEVRVVVCCNEWGLLHFAWWGAHMWRML